MKDDNDENANSSINFDRRTFLMNTGAAALVAVNPLSVTANAAEQKRLPVIDYTPEDNFFGKAYIDVDEWHDMPSRFRYVHGGFEGTDTRFSFYFPEKSVYGGRFFQALPGGVGGDEHSILSSINPAKVTSDYGVVPKNALAAAFDSKGYIIESNQGHLGEDMSGVKGQQSVLCYRASAAAARFSKVMAAEMYGAAPKYGYLFGGSGGSVRSINCLEYVKDVWDGAVPFVSPMQSASAFFSVQANAVRLLGPTGIASVAEAMEVGGSGNPFEHLDAQQAQALQILFQSGYPRGIDLRNPFEQVHVWTFTDYAFNKDDPTYYADFWSKPGYVGHDEPHLVEQSRVLVKTRVRHVMTAKELLSYKPPFETLDERGWGRRFIERIVKGPGADPNRVVAIVPEGGREVLGKMGCSHIIFESGAAKGRERIITGVLGDALFGYGLSENMFEGAKPGDQITIDNKKYLAYCYHYRHQVEPEFREWSHSVMDGNPIYPQRPKPPRTEAIFPYNFDVGNRKMIFVSSMQDRGVFMSGVCATMEQIKRLRGDNFFANNVRVWLTDHAWHGSAPGILPDEPAPVYASRIVNYHGTVLRALKALVAWVEEGKVPLPSTNYTYTRDCNVLLPPSAAERKGVQPVVDLKGNGKMHRVEIKRGETVSFAALAECPPGTGVIMEAAWDFNGTGSFLPDEDNLRGNSSRSEFKANHRYEKPGTYFACVRVSGYPDTKPENKIYKQENLGRIRIVVS